MSRHYTHNNQSFTLVELLIVIGILAILTAAIIVVLNPAELLKQARDSKRIQDLSGLENNINISQALATSISLGTASTVYVSIADDTSSSCATLSLPSLPAGYSYACVTESNLHNTDGTGWIPINFQDAALSGVIQLSTLPIDPTNATSSYHYYTYVPEGSYKLAATLESEKYAENASDDGGIDYAAYEKGTDLALAPFSHGPVGWWKFDGDATDSSGYGYDGTAYGGVTYATGKQGQAAQFDGSTGYVSLTNPALGSSAMTICTWAYKDNFVQYQSFIADYNSSGQKNFIMGYENPSLKLKFFVGDGSSADSIESATMFVLDAWRLYCGVFQGGQELSLYADGNLVTTKQTPINSIGSTQSSNSYIGRYASYSFDGLIDNIMIYNRGLSASEILGLYEQTQ
jgi:competence protein ComGC